MEGLINPFCSRKRCGHTYYANATDKALAGEVGIRGAIPMVNQQTGGTRVVANSYNKSGDLLVTKEFFLGKEEL